MDYFAKVEWCAEDIENALEVSSIPATEENIATVLNALDNHFFTDYLISAGWDYIYQTIENTDF